MAQVERVVVKRGEMFGGAGVATLNVSRRKPSTPETNGSVEKSTTLDLRNLPEDPILVAVRDAQEEQKHHLTSKELAERFKNMTYEQIEKLASDLM